MKKGLDPEALTGKYPPKIRMYSKYERRTDTRTYEDRKKLYEGGWTVLYSEVLEKDWKEKHDDWAKRSKAKLPKWFGEGLAKKLVTPNPLMAMMKLLPLPSKSKRMMMRKHQKKMMRKKRKRRRKKKKRKKKNKAKPRPCVRDQPTNAD